MYVVQAIHCTLQCIPAAAHSICRLIREMRCDARHCMASTCLHSLAIKSGLDPNSSYSYAPSLIRAAHSQILALSLLLLVHSL